MAIKLADVLNNVNSAYPVLEAHDQTIVGLYNGVTGLAPILQVSYQSSIKVNLTSDGNWGGSQKVQVTKLPYATSEGTGLVTADTPYNLYTRQGGIITALDSGMGMVPGEPWPSVYVVGEDPTVGTTQDLSRPSLDRFGELIQQYNVYPALNESQLATALTDGDLTFSVFHEGDYRTYKFTAADWISIIGNELGTALVSGGIITASEGNGGGSGAVGDVNGDGQVSVADILTILGQFGSTGVGFNSVIRCMIESDETSPQLPAPAGGGIPATGTGGLTDWDNDLVHPEMPSNYTTSNDIYGITTADLPATSATHSHTWNTNFNSSWDATSPEMDLWDNKWLRVVAVVQINTPIPSTFLWAFAKITITTDDASNSTYSYVMILRSYPFQSAQEYVQIGGNAPGTSNYPYGSTTGQVLSFFGTSQPSAIFDAIGQTPSTMSNADYFVGVNSFATQFGFNLGFSQYNFDSSTGAAGTEALIKNIEVELGFHCSDPDAEIFLKQYRSALDNKGHFEAM